MSSEKQFQRDAEGFRFLIAGGMNTVSPPDLLPNGKYAYLANVRRYLDNRAIARAPQGANILPSALPSGITSLTRLNDTTPDGPPAGYVLISGAGGTAYVGSTAVKTKLSGLPLSSVQFRPNASPQPWQYTADPNASFKIRSDATTWKTGIFEPQIAPVIGLNGTTITGSFTLNVNAAPWTNYGDANSGVNYGEISYGGGGADLGPGIIGNLVGGASLTITASGSATINGTTHVPSDAGPTGSNYPGNFVVGGSPKILLGAFTDINGNVVTTTSGGTTYAAYNVGSSATLTVPPDAVQFQIGVDSAANTFFENSGSFAISFSLTISAVSPNLSIAGNVTAYYWGDSPHSGPVAEYIWKNSDDTGSGTPRNTSTASGSASNSSLIFDSLTFNPSDPQNGTAPVLWQSLNTSGMSPGGAIPLFDPALETEGYQDFNACITCSLFLPAAGEYTFQFTNKDQIMVGIGGGATIPGGYVTGPFGQTETVVNGLPLIYVSTPNGTGGAVTGSVTINAPSQGIYSFEVNWDYWYHTGRSMIVEASPTPGAGAALIPPLNTAEYHINAQYRYTYRSTPTGATSNPSPESLAQTIPLQANSLSSTWSSDPQVDVVDYYRLDEGLDNFTYVATGPNDNAAVGGVTITNGGTGYTGTPTVTFSAPPSGATAQGTAIVSGGSVVAVTITNFGSGYVTPPTVTFSAPGSGTTATGVAVMTNTPIIDTLTDTAVAGNPLLNFDNYEPFPSVDLPAKGIINVGNNGDITWVSGTQFNIRWLAGSVILIGSPASVAYTLYNRPAPNPFATGTVYEIGNVIKDSNGHYQKVTTGGTSGGSVPIWNDSGGTTTSGGVVFADQGTRIDLISGTTTTMTIPGVPGGNNLAYEIQEPTLAAQLSPVLWGPTANSAFAFGLDPLNTGDLVWTNGNDFDSAADTNRLVVTSPSEPLMNGTVSGELNTVFSTERFWLIYPTFTQAYATVAGITGNQWTLIQSGGTRGLYMRYALCTDGADTTFFRAKDCIAATAGGGPEQSITGDIYNLFPHEGEVPQSVTIGGNTVYPPDDTRPNAQTLSFARGYLYYNYQDITGTQRTLIYDVEGKGWSVDIYGTPVNVHYWPVGPTVNEPYVGCSDGTVRILGTGGTELATAVIATPSMNGGDARGFKKIGDVFFKGQIASSSPVSVAMFANRYTTPITGFAPTSLTGTGVLTPYIIDFSSGYGDDLIDIAAQFSWPIAGGTIVDIWSPTFISRPEATQDRPTDWSDGGYTGAKFVQGCILERDTFGKNKVFSVQSADDFSIHTPNETPCNFPVQSIQAFSVAPFIAHSMRIISTDGVPWQGWDTKFVFEPYPEECLNWTTELMSYGPGWQHIRYFNIVYIASAPVTLTVFFDQIPTITLANILPATASQLYPTKTFVQMPPNKTKLMGFTLSSTAKMRIFKPQLQVEVGVWGRTSEYEIMTPFGGNASDGAEV